MAEIADIGQPHPPVGPGQPQRARIEAAPPARAAARARRRRRRARPAAASAEAATTVARQSGPPRKARRCGSAEPTVSAPTKSPTSAPRSRVPQPTSTFIPTG